MVPATTRRRLWLLMALACAPVISASVDQAARGQVVRLPSLLPDEADVAPWDRWGRVEEPLLRDRPGHPSGNFGAMWRDSYGYGGEGVAPASMLAGEPAIDFHDQVEPPAETLASGPPGAKSGPLQQVRWTNTWLAPGGAAGMGMYDLGLQASIAFPFFTRQSPMILTPGYGVHYLDGPTITDMPSRVHDAFLDIRWIRPLMPNVMADLAVTPGVYSDFAQDHDKAFRLTGRGLAIIDQNPQTRWVVGVAYLNRRNVSVLPVGGVIWTPDDITKFELIMPQPRIARLLNPCDSYQWWGYVGGEFGGGVWAIERLDGESDRVTYNDLRFMLGMECLTPWGNSARFEVGYVFNRKLLYDRDDSRVGLDDTVMLRALLQY